MNVSAIFFGFVVFLVLSSCGGKDEGKRAPDGKELWNKLEKTNMILAAYEREEILDFVSRRGWEMKETGSGLWIDIYEKGDGPKASFGKKVVVSYTIMLLNGEVVYSSASLGNKVFVVGRGGVEAGLEEGILLLGAGDKARLIMPPHLAHGFHGDGERIPRRASIVYDMEVLSIE